LGCGPSEVTASGGGGLAAGTGDAEVALVLTDATDCWPAPGWLPRSDWQDRRAARAASVARQVRRRALALVIVVLGRAGSLLVVMPS
jgi:hypothetical protein